MSYEVSFDKSEHALSLVERLLEMRTNVKQCDFVIEVGFERIPAHRNILTAMSDYFDGMLSHDTIENSFGVVNMDCLDPDCVRICVDYIYGKNSTISEDKYEGLMYVANLMQLNKLAGIVENIIGQNLNVNSFFVARRIADMYGCGALESKCRQFAIENLAAISMEGEFVDLDKRYVIKIMKNRCVKTVEADKLDAALKWVKYDVEARNEDLAHFLQAIDLNLVSIEKRRQLLDNDSLIKENVTSVRILSASMIDSIKIQSEKSKEKAILVFDNNSGSLQEFRSRFNSWRKMHQMSDVVKKKHFSAIVCGYSVFIFVRKKKVFRLKYTDETAKWKKMAKMLTQHGWCPPVAVIGKSFFAIGGHADCFTKCVERYEVETNKWIKLQDKPQSTSGSTLLVMRGCIYNFGGRIEEEGRISNVQRFDPATSEWEEMQPMKEAKLLVAAVEFDDKAYVMGGFGETCLNSVDCYDPDLDQWTTLASMLIQRSSFRAFAMDGSIYAAGGYDSSPDSIEKYDVEKKKWTMVPMPSLMKINILESVEIRLDK